MERTFDHVVLGGGCGGVETAFHLRRLAPGASIALVSPVPYLVFKPWLIYLPAGRVTVEATRADLRRFAGRWGLELVEGCAAEVDDDGRRVRLAGGDSLRCGRLAIATGATSDRERVAGAAEHAIWPCDVEGALELSARFTRLTEGTVTVILAGERPGPGLEYAGWMARALTAPGGRRDVRLRVVDHEDALARQLGPRAMAVLGRWMRGWGGSLVEDSRVSEVGPGHVDLADGRRLDSRVTAVVGPLRGAGPALPAGLADERGLVSADEHLRTPAEGVFAVGDVAALPAGRELPRAWEMARLEARAAAWNMVAAGTGAAPAPLDFGRARRLDFNMPNVGGRTVMVRGGRLLMSGRLPLVIKTRMERRYLAERFP